MKNKINLLLFLAVVSVRESQQHGTKGGGFSGSFSSSSSSSQSSSSSSSSSSSFTATGSFNDLGSGLKHLTGNLGDGGANTGSHFGSLGSSGANNGASLSGSSSTSGGFANSGSGAGFIGVQGTHGVVGSGSTAGSIGGGFAGVSCTLGKKGCEGDSGAKNENLNGSGSQSGSVTGNSKAEVNGIIGGGTADASSQGVSAGETSKNSDVYGPSSSNPSVPKPVNIIKEKPVTENEEDSAGSWSASGTGTNTIPGSSGTDGSGKGSITGGYTGSTINTGSSSQIGGSFKPSLEGNYDSNSGLPAGGPSTTSPHASNQWNAPGLGFPVGSQVSTPGFPSGNENPSASNPPTGSQPTVSSHPINQGNPPSSGFPAGNQPPSTVYPQGHGNHPGLGLPIGTQPTISFYPSGQGHQHSSPAGTITHGSSGSYTGSQTGSFNTGNNFGSQAEVNGHANLTPKKPCCTGPFPGPSGSIYESKPAHLVPPIPRPGGSFSSPGINTAGVVNTGVATTGVTTGGSSNGPCCKGPFPGPNGSIHDSKPAHSVPLNPSSPGAQPSLPSVPLHPPSGSQVTGSNGGYGPSNTFGSPGIVGVHPPPFPGPTGSIHESKPATSVTSVNPSGNKYNGPFPGPSGGILTPVAVTAGSTDYSSAKQHHEIKPTLPSRGHSTYIHHVAKPSIALNPPLVNQYPSQPTTFIDSNRNADSGYATGTVTVQKPDNTQWQTRPDSGSLNYGSTNSGSRNNYEDGFATGSVIVQKPDGTVPGGKNIPSSSLAGTASESQAKLEGSSSIFAGSGSSRNKLGSSDSENPSDITRPVITSQYHSNPTTVKPSSNKPNLVPNFGYASGNVEKLDVSQPEVKPNDLLTYGSTDSGSGNSGFATGQVVVQKPDATVTGGKNLPSSHSSVGTAPRNDNGHATLNFVIQKPDGSISGNRYILGSTVGGSDSKPESNIHITQITSGSPSGFGSLDSGSGYAVGGVLIQKPDGTVTRGKDTSSLGTSGVYSSGVKGGFGHKGVAGSYTFGSSGSAGFGSSSGSDLFGLSDNGAFGIGNEGGAVHGSTGFGSYAGSHASAGSSSSAFAGPVAFSGGKSGSYAGANSGAEAGFTGLLKGLVGKYGLGGNLGVAGAGSGSFSKSHSYASSASYAGASSSSYSGHY